MRDVIGELVQRKNDGILSTDISYFKGLRPPLSAENLAKAEEELRFSLHPTLGRLYTDVGNGGFGPQYGILGLKGGMLNEDHSDAVKQYQFYRSEDPDDPHWNWPVGLLPVGHLGCAMYLCVDCDSEDGQMIWFEPNSHEEGQSWKESFIPFCESVDLWLASWIDGDDLFEKIVEEA